MNVQADRARLRAPRPGLLQRLGLLGVEGKRRRRTALSLSVATSLLFGGLVTTSGGLSTSAAAPIGAGFELDAGDLRFILRQITIAEHHVATDPSDCAALLGTDVATNVVEPRLPYGLRTVDGSCNHLTPGTYRYGAADIVFPRLTAPVFRDAETVPAGVPPQFGIPGEPTTYDSTGPSANVFDTEPRLISNLIVDQSDGNPAAFVASGGCAEREGFDNDGDGDADTCFTGNTAPDAGLSAPFNSMFTFFGQFFDHGLDLVNKGGNGTVFVPLRPDDALYSTAPGAFNFLTLTRATNVNPGGRNEGNNQTTSYVDQNQTYTSHPSHQVFLREYELRDLPGDQWGPIPVATGHLIDGAIEGNIANWGEVKAQARDVLGIELTDLDVGNVPLVATDPYGQFLRGGNGFPVVIFPGNTGSEGNLATPVSVTGSEKTDHAFLDDIAHNAVPTSRTGAPLTPDANIVPDPIFQADGRTPNLMNPGEYDDELLDAHFVTGDGRGNENIALTAVHTIFHAEHNRLAHEIDQMIQGVIPTELTAAERALWSAPSVAGWSYGDRIFQAARFVTEMEYQHLVFEEFARTMAPSINAFAPDGINFQAQVDPSITAEFAHSVYRFGHSMLNESVERIDPETGQRDTISLFEGFLNPVEFNKGGALTAAQAAGEIFQGSSRQVGNEIDEFVTDSLRNNLLGRPLDLATLNIARGRSEGIPPLNEVRRQLFERFSHSSLAPYGNWDEFGFAMRNTESLVNFIAAYGTHPIIQAETTVERRRAAGNAIVNEVPYPGADGVLGDDPTTPIVGDEGADDVAGSPALPGPDGVLGDDPLTLCTAPNDPVGCDEGADDIPAVPAGPGPDGVQGDDPATAITGDESADDILPPADLNDFFFGEGTWAGVETGVNLIDLWMGGLAEKPAPFGGMLGSTFNFVFETQLENLQNADRFYYLERLDGLNLLAQLEGNSFAEIVMRNSTARALPGSIFNRPEFVFRINGSNQVVDDPTTPLDEAAQVQYLSQGRIRYGGDQHVIWDGSPNGDSIISSEGDDTLRGNDGDDRIEGGSGNDQPIGGLGDDVITDNFGDDVIKGGPGHDAIAGGPGLDLLQGNGGDDFMVGGNDFTESFGGEGDDVMFIGDSFAEAFAGFGDDWMEGSGQLDLLVGDENNQFQDDPNGGDDVIKGNGGDDDYDSEGGNDIMIADVLGTERIEGMLGFDWATYQNDPLPVDADMRITLALPPQVIETRDRYDKTEGMSGWNNNDTLRGDDRGCPPQAAALGLCLDALAEGTVVDNELLQEDIDTIENLRSLLLTAVGPEVNDAGYMFDDGNILLGGAGSDVIEGRGGNDVIDGDRYLTANLRAVHPGTGAVIETDNMKSLQSLVFAAPPAPRLHPGSIDIVRRIQTPATLPAGDCGQPGPVNCDTAVFTGAPSEYVFTNGAGVLWVTHVPDPLDPTTIGPDGMDALLGIERFMYLNNTPDNGADDVIIDPNVVVDFSAGPNPVDFGIRAANGSLATRIVTVTNDGTSPSPVSIVSATFAPEEPAADHPPFPFTVDGTGCVGTTLAEGQSCDITVGFQVSPEPLGGVETADAYATQLIVNVQGGLPAIVDVTGEAVDNTPAVGAPDVVLLPAATGFTVGQQVTIDVTNVDDLDGVPAVAPGNFTVTWQTAGGLALPGSGYPYTIPPAAAGSQIRAVVSFTDGAGFAEGPLVSPATPVVGAVINTATGNIAQTVTGTAGDDLINTFGGADTVNAGAGADTINGGPGDDTLAGQGGDDTFVFVGTTGGFDAITGGAGVDTIEGRGAGDVVIGLRSVATVEAIRALQAGATAVIRGNGAGNTFDFRNVTLTNIDAIEGAGGADQITGSAGDDVIIGGAGNDTLNGFAGADVFEYPATAFGTDLLSRGFGAGGGAEQDEVRFPAGVTVVRSGANANRDTVLTVRLTATNALLGTIRIERVAPGQITEGADYFIG